MFSEKLAAAMLLLLSKEVPALRQTSPETVKWTTSIQTISTINIETAKQSQLVSTEVDTVLFTSIQFFENRWRVDGPDGDCRVKWVGGKRGRNVRVCNAVGPMQVAASNTPLFASWPETELWAGLSRKDLRVPENNIPIGAAILKRWKNQCGGAPGVWLTAYGWGRCPPKNYVDFEGKRRCQLAVKLLKMTDALPPDWRCGHESSRSPVVRGT